MIMHVVARLYLKLYDTIILFILLKINLEIF